MGLRESKGNMYGFITHTWNPIKGKCYHDCLYCYMKKWKGKFTSPRLDINEFIEFQKDIRKLGHDLIIFVGSGIDMFAEDINPEWIKRIIEFIMLYYDETYFFQSKNPSQFDNYNFPKKTILCTTIETNRYYRDIMKYSPNPNQRLNHKCDHITIEPILDFDLSIFIDYIKLIEPVQINIGADSCGYKMPEPPKEKIIELIFELQKFTKVVLKKNLNRLIK